MSKEKNRIKTIKSTILTLFLIIIVLWIGTSILFIFVYANLNGISKVETSKILLSLPFIFYICAILISGLVIFFKIVIMIKTLDEYALLDSNEINKLIAKNTAPFRERYYLLYNTTKQKERKIITLRKQLEKLYSASKNKKINLEINDDEN